MKCKVKLQRAALIGLLILLPAIISAQPSKIDSLLQKLSASRKDTNRVNILCNLSFEYWLKNPDSGLVYGFQAVGLAKKLDWQRGLAKAYNNCGTNFLGKTEWDQSLTYYFNALGIYRKLGDQGGIASSLGNIGNSYFYKSEYDQALKYFSKALLIDSLAGNERGVAKHFGNMGNVYMGQSNYPKAFEHYTRALAMQTKIGNKPAEAIMLSNIGAIYAQWSDYPRALDYTFKAMDMDEKLGNTVSQARHLGTIGTIYYEAKYYPKALEYLFRALQMNKSIKSEYAIGTNLTNIGNVYLETDHFDDALRFMQEALTLFQKLQSQAEIALVLGSMGDLYVRENDFKEALRYFDSSLKIYKEIGKASGVASSSGKIGELYFKMATDSLGHNPDEKTVSINKQLYLKNACTYLEEAVALKGYLGEKHKEGDFLATLSKVYEALGDYQQALKYFRQHQQIQDSVFSQENQGKIAALETRKEMELRDRQIQYQSLKLEKNKLQRLSLAGGLVLMLLLVAALVFFLTRLSRQKSISESLLLNILPASVANRLKKKENYIVDRIDQASIVFIDIVNFTGLSKDVGAKRIVESLNEIFTAFDHAAGKFGLEKIKTIGDCYMAAAGVPLPQPDHALRAAKMALYVISLSGKFKVGDVPVQFRIGVNCGEVTAGVIGEKKFIYDLWGDTVNIAARMESYGKPGEIHVTDHFYRSLRAQMLDFESNELTNKDNPFPLGEAVIFVDLGPQQIKGKGIMQTWFLRMAAKQNTAPGIVNV